MSKRNKKLTMLFQIATLIQNASTQPFIPKGYSFESVSKSEPLMRIIKYAIVFAYQKKKITTGKSTKRYIIILTGQQPPLNQSNLPQLKEKVFRSNQKKK